MKITIGQSLSGNSPRRAMPSHPDREIIPSKPRQQTSRLAILDLQAKLANHLKTTYPQAKESWLLKISQDAIEEALCHEVDLMKIAKPIAKRMAPGRMAEYLDRIKREEEEAEEQSRIEEATRLSEQPLTEPPLNISQGLFMQPSDGDRIDIGEHTCTFRLDPQQEDEIQIGADLQATRQFLKEYKNALLGPDAE
jgi:hypothetical protein